MLPARLCTGLLDLLAPRRCPGCDHPHFDPVPFCDACAPLLEPVTESGVEAGVWRFQGPLADAVHRLKYRGRTDLGAPLAEALWLGSASLEGFDLVAPVPLHPARLRARGYNQSALLAAPLARRLGIPLKPELLARVRNTPGQVGASRAERVDNVRGAFAAPRAAAGRVLVVDDVRTSGATLAEACLTLRRAGARQARGLALAQAPLGGTTPA